MFPFGTSSIMYKCICSNTYSCGYVVQGCVIDRETYKLLTTVVIVVFLVVFHWCSCLECHVHVP